jgi:hypothetical protein
MGQPLTCPSSCWRQVAGPVLAELISPEYLEFYHFAMRSSYALIVKSLNSLDRRMVLCLVLIAAAGCFIRLWPMLHRWGVQMVRTSYRFCSEVGTRLQIRSWGLQIFVRWRAFRVCLTRSPLSWFRCWWT